MPELRKIRLLGELGRRFGRVHQLAVATPAEAIRALCVLRPGFREFMDSRERHFQVLVRKQAVEDLDRELHMKRPVDADFTIAPVISGAKSALGRIILGVVIIAAAFYTGGASLAANGSLVYSGLAGQIAFGIGAAMVVGGVAQLLAPTPSFGNPGDESRPSYLFNGPVQTTQQGYPVPVGYGELLVGGAQISAGVWAEDIPV